MRIVRLKQQTVNNHLKRAYLPLKHLMENVNRQMGNGNKMRLFTSMFDDRCELMFLLLWWQ